MRTVAVGVLAACVAFSAGCGNHSVTTASVTSPPVASATTPTTTQQVTAPVTTPCVLTPAAIGTAFGDALTSPASAGSPHDSNTACDYEVGFQGTTITVAVRVYPYAEEGNTVSTAGPYDDHAWLIGGPTPQAAYASLQRMAQGRPPDQGVDHLHPEIGAGAFLNSDLDVYVATTGSAWYYLQLTNVTAQPAIDPYVIALGRALASADQ